MRGAPIKRPFTAEQDDYLRRIYAEHAHRRPKLHEALVDFARRLSYPREALTTRAKKLGIVVPRHHRPWTPEEDLRLEEMAGQRSVKAIAQALRRGHHSVECRIKRLGMSFRVREGYAVAHIAAVMGVSQPVASTWIVRGYIRVNRETRRASEQEMRRFLECHPEQYDLRRVDQAWFKGMIFPKFGLSATAPRKTATVEFEEQEERATA